jgi:hypothetical protein
MASDSASPGEMPRATPDPLALGEDQAARLLDGHPTADAAPPGYQGVARLLQAAAGPASADELAGEAAAVAAFRAAGPPAARRPAHRRSRGGRRVRLVAIAVAALLLAGGVAAAAGGHLPVPLGRAWPAAHTTAGQAPAAAAHQRSPATTLQRSPGGQAMPGRRPAPPAGACKPKPTHPGKPAHDYCKPARPLGHPHGHAGTPKRHRHPPGHN